MLKKLFLILISFFMLAASGSAVYAEEVLEEGSTNIISKNDISGRNVPTIAEKMAADPDSIRDISVGDTVSVTVAAEEVVDFRFIPEYDYVYIFESLAAPGIDTCVLLFDENFAEIGSSDDDGLYSNFRLEELLMEGETYYFRVYLADADASARFTVRLTALESEGLNELLFVQDIFTMHSEELMPVEVCLFTDPEWDYNSLTFESSDENVVRKVGDYFEAGAAGTATVTVTSEEYDLSTSAEFIVGNYASEILADGDTEIYLKKGGTAELKYTLESEYDDLSDEAVTWTIEDGEGVISLVEGNVTALDYGTAVVTASIVNGSFVEYVIHVYEDAESVSFKGDLNYLGLDQTRSVWEYLDYSPEGVRYSSISVETSNRRTVQADGTDLYGLSKGNATVTVTFSNGESISAEFTVTDPITANSATMALEGLLKVNFYLTIPADQTDTTYIRMKLASKTEGIRVKASDATLDDQGRRFFQCPIASTQMNEMITMTAEDEEGNKLPMYTAGGRDLTEGLDYSAMTYINNRVNNPSTAAKMKALLSAAGEYGRNAQKNFGYGTLDQEPVTITDVTAETLKPYSLIRGGSCEGVTLKSATLECESGTNVHVYFTLSADANINDYDCKVDGVTATPEWSADKAAYRISSKDIASNQLQKMFTFTICKKTETEGITLSYGAFSYGYSKLSNTSTNAALANMVKSLYKYNLAAIEYFGN